jgi:hypothetical protein
MYVERSGSGLVENFIPEFAWREEENREKRRSV